MDDDLPKLIRIMPDYGPSYAEDEHQSVLDISNYFEAHPKIQVIRDIESKLYALAVQIDDRVADENPNFPWEQHDREAFELAKALAHTLGETGIPIFYRPHYNNPSARKSEEILVSNV